MNELILCLFIVATAGFSVVIILIKRAFVSVTRKFKINKINKTIRKIYERHDNTDRGGARGRF